MAPDDDFASSLGQYQGARRDAATFVDTVAANASSFPRSSMVDDTSTVPTTQRTRSFVKYRPVVALAAGAVLVRLVTLGVAVRDPLFTTARFDELAFLERAGLSAESVRGALPVSPAYVAFVAVVGRLHQHPMLAIALANAALGVSTVVATFLLARRWARTSAALVACTVLALNGPMLYAETRPSCDVLVAAALAWAAWGWTRWAEQPTLRRALVGACALAVAIAARATAIAALPFVVVIAYRRTRSLTAPALACAAATMLAAPSWVYNARHGDPTPFVSVGAVNAWIGNGPGATGTWRRPENFRPGPRTDDLVDEMIRVESASVGRELSAGEARSALWVATARHASRHPGATVRLLFDKVRRGLEHVELGDNRDWYFERRLHPLLGSWLVTSTAWLIVPGVLGLGRLRRSRRAWPMLVCCVIPPLATMVGFYVLGRYRFALLPALAVGAAALVELSIRARATRGHLAPLAAAVVALGVVVFRPDVPAEAAPPRLMRAVELHRLGRTDDALASYAEALELARARHDRESRIVALTNRALARLDTGRTIEALEDYRELDALLAEEHREHDRAALRRFLEDKGVSPSLGTSFERP